MTNIQLFMQINSLPQDLVNEVADFIEFIIFRKKSSKAKHKRVFGYAKDSIIIKPGFDEPMEDFKEYM